MPPPKKLLNYLQQKKAKYELLPHKTVYTAYDLAQTLGVKPKEVIKTLVVKLNGKEPVVLMLTADKNIDKKKLLNTVNAWIENKKSMPEARILGEKIHGRARSLEFAAEKWMREKVLGKPGATPPFGAVLKMTVFMDKGVLGSKRLVVNSGDYKASIVMSNKDFIAQENPVVGRFGKLRT